jgi:hypothetical protein
MKANKRSCSSVTPLQVAKQECANAGMSGEEWLARLYCQPKAFWRCTQQLDGSAYYTFKEINYPEYWLQLVEKYTQEKPSAAAGQLHRRVEAARAVFRAKQENAWGTGKVDRNRFERLEASARETFNRQKQVYLKDYLKAVTSGVTKRRRLTHKCQQCGEGGVRIGCKFCEFCSKERKRESKRNSKAKRAGLKAKLGTLQLFQSEPLTKALSSEKGHLATTIAGISSCLGWTRVLGSQTTAG